MPKGMPSNLVDETFGSLRVLKECDVRDGNSTYWWYECECGEVDVASTGNLCRMKSCGCKNDESRRSRRGIKNPQWLGGKHIHGSVAWCRKKLRELVAKAKYCGYAPPTATPERIAEIWGASSGTCDICGVPDAECNRAHAIDHDHITGHVRGILCQHCNNVLGFAKDTPAVLRLAATYLENTCAKK